MALFLYAWPWQSHTIWKFQDNGKVWMCGKSTKCCDKNGKNGTLLQIHGDGGSSSSVENLGKLQLWFYQQRPLWFMVDLVQGDHCWIQMTLQGFFFAIGLADGWFEKDFFSEPLCLWYSWEISHHGNHGGRRRDWLFTDQYHRPNRGDESCNS